MSTASPQAEEHNKYMFDVEHGDVGMYLVTWKIILKRGDSSICTQICKLEHLPVL